MTVATYAPRVKVHPDRVGTAKSGENRVAVLHTSEQSSELAGSAQSLATYMTTAGDRTTSSGDAYGSSYHVVFDLDLLVRPCVRYDLVAYSAPGANHNGVHGCFPGRAGQTRDQWLDRYSRSLIRTAAAWLVDVRDDLGIPLVRLSVADLRAGRSGYCDHDTVSKAFGRTNHYDVGPAFPWDVLAADLADLTTPPPPDPEPEPEDDDMPQFIAREEGSPRVFVGDRIRRGWVEGPDVLEAVFRMGPLLNPVTLERVPDASKIPVVPIAVIEAMGSGS